MGFFILSPFTCPGVQLLFRPSQGTGGAGCCESFCSCCCSGGFPICVIKASMLISSVSCLTFQELVTLVIASISSMQREFIPLCFGGSPRAQSAAVVGHLFPAVGWMHEWLGLSQLIWFCQVVGSLKNMKLYSNLKFYVTFKEKGILESKNENVEDSKLL